MRDDVAVVALAAPDQRAHACVEFGERERLHEVVVGAGVESRDAVGERVLRGHDQHGHGLAPVAQLLEHDPPRHPRQAEIEDHEVEPLRAQRSVGRDAVAQPVHRMPGALQERSDRVAELRIVFRQQDPHGFHSPGGGW